MKTKPRTTRALMAAALCAVAMFTGSASAGAWAYDSTAMTITHDETPWVLNVSRSGSQLTIDSVATRAESFCALPLGDIVSGGYSITAIKSATSSSSGVFYGYSTGYYIRSLTLPPTLKTIGDYAFAYCWNLTGALTIPDSVTHIGDYAFSGCSGLTGALTIPNSVTHIGDEAFYNCQALTSVTLGNSVTHIGDNAFYDCWSLTNLSVSAGNAAYASVDGVLFSKDQKTLIRYPAGKAEAYSIPDGVTSIGDAAFSGCDGLTGALTIPDSVTTIGDHAFAFCSGLTGVTLGTGMTHIDGSAFYGCWSLANLSVSAGNTAHASVDGILFSKDQKTLILYPAGKTGGYSIPDSVTSIGDYAFSGCEGLTSVTLGNSVTNIGDEAFSSCDGLTGALTIPDSVTSIGDRAFFQCDGLTSVTIGNSVTSIGDGAFSFCYGLTGALTIGNSVTNIGDSAFSFCRGLTSVTIPDSVTSIGDAAFYDCYGLTSVTIGNSVTSIGDGAFSFCYGLTGALTIGNSVTSIGYDAFFYCLGLTSVTIGTSVTSIGDGAFSGCYGLTGVAFNGLCPSYVGGEFLLGLLCRHNLCSPCECRKLECVGSERSH